MSITITAVTTYATTTTTTASRFFLIPIRCSDSNPKRGFGTKTNGSNKNSKRNKAATSKEQKSMMLQQRNSTTKQSGDVSSQAPGLSSRFGGKSSNISLDLEFEERLKAVKRSALEQKKADEEIEFRAIDYDAPIKSDNKTIGFGTKIGVGVAVVLFGLVFALGDFLPSGSVSPTEDAATVNSKLSEEEKVILQTRLKEYEVTLSNSPKDAAALEGAAVTLAELGEYTRATSLLEDLKKENPNDPDVFRLLGEVKYKLKDYGGSADAYKTASVVSPYLNFEVLRGHTNALLAAKKPEEAVQVLLASKERLSKENLDVRTERTSKETDPKKVDPVQVDLLLGKAYSDWGHIADAVSVYDQLISSHPNDFRGYLAKGIILKENGKLGDAERMFIQARFFAPDGAKGLVDRYAK